MRQLELQRHGMRCENITSASSYVSCSEPTAATAAGLGIVRRLWVFSSVGVSRGVCENGGGGGLGWKTGNKRSAGEEVLSAAADAH
jgi:hypothetical protein